MSAVDQPTPIVIGLGEVLWDCFPDSRRPGGAPANVAFQANQLGCHGSVASRIGSDDLGDELKQYLVEKQLNIDLLQTDDAHPTGRVTVDVSDSGHPDYTIHEDVAWDYLQADDTLLSAMRTAAAVCFGTLAQRSPTARETIHAGLSATRSDTLRVFDVNLRQQWYDRNCIERSFDHADVVKLNHDELEVIAQAFELESATIEALSAYLFKEHAVSLLCLTKAEKGCRLISPDDDVSVPGKPVEVVDAVGAGDAFTAALIVGLLEGWPLEPIANFANAVGGRVAASAGAMPELREELAELKAVYAAPPLVTD